MRLKILPKADPAARVVPGAQPDAGDARRDAGGINPDDAGGRDERGDTTMIGPTMTLGDLVTAAPAAARVLERFGLDYCCGGAQHLDEACAAARVDPRAVLAALAAVAQAPPAEWAAMGPAELVDHLESTHHAYLRSELPRLTELALKVGSVHGDRHPELDSVRATFEDLRTELEPHLAKEERVLFPAIRALAAATRVPPSPFGSVRNPISVMLVEHDRAGALLARLRASTDGYATPADGCASYRALYEGLEALEADTHLHVHKENNVLFPAVVALEQRLARE
jgi:regulator of cell morphogenesis and NO signaling